MIQVLHCLTVRLAHAFEAELVNGLRRLLTISVSVLNIGGPSVGPIQVQVSVVDSLGNPAFFSNSTMTVLPGQSGTIAGGGTFPIKFPVYRVVVNVLGDQRLIVYQAYCDGGRRGYWRPIDLHSEHRISSVSLVPRWLPWEEITTVDFHVYWG